MAELGFLGLGHMGGAMARRLVDAGHRVIVWNRSRSETLDELVGAGAVAAGSPAEALATDVSFSMLADDRAALGVLEAFRAGSLHVSMASLSPSAVDELGERAAAAGARLVAAPVLGRPQVAAAGKLNILAAGADEDVAEATPHLEVLGARIWRFGTRPSQANVAKIAVNYNIIHAMQAIGESLSLVEANDLDGGEFVELLSSTLFAGVVYTGYGKAIADRAYHPAGFTASLGLKDLGLAEEVAGDAGFVLPSAVVLRDGFEDALADPELAEGDWAVLGEVARRRAAG